MRNILLILAYDGTDFAGWQRQPDAPTIQGCVEEALGKLLGEKVVVCGSGRTDAGVHALNQAANFKTSSTIPGENLVKALNNLLPPTIRIKEAREVPAEFHARYDAQAKTYRYRILQAPVCSPFLGRFVCHYPYPLDRPRMAEAAQLLEGEHDFTSFAAVEKPLVGEGLHGPPEEREHHKGAPLPREDNARMVRKVFYSRLLWRPRTSILVYEARGSGFLHHMVRNIVGTLIEVGRGNLEPQDLLRILAARDRTQAGPTAPAKGLCLVKVEY